LNQKVGKLLKQPTADYTNVEHFDGC